MKTKLKIILALLLIVILSGGIIMYVKSQEKSAENNTNDNVSKTTTKNTNKSYTSNETLGNTATSNNTVDNETVDNQTHENEKSTTESSTYEQYAKEQMADPEEGETIAIIHVKNYGDITVKFFDAVAPKAAQNFITHAKDGYYDGVIFHRVINEFMIQGGDPLGTGYGGESIWGKGFEEELSQKLLPYRGSLCMASAGTGTSSLGSQFFITQAHYDEETAQILEQYYGFPKEIMNMYKKYGGYMSLYQQYTIFGQVIDGMDVVDKIAVVETSQEATTKDKPLEDVVIESIEVTTYKK